MPDDLGGGKLGNAELWSWMEGSFDELPGTDDELFHQLWKAHRLRYRDPSHPIDKCDELASRLLVAAFRKRERLLVVLPDPSPQRPPTLLATLLIRDLVDRRDAPVPFPGGRILYFGARTGIREHLHEIAVPGRTLDLTDVFRQEDLARGGRRRPRSQVDSPITPRITTVYSPADPVALLDEYKPPWVAVDCSDAAQLSWLEPLLREAAVRRIPVLAWSTNPFSEPVRIFRKVGRAFVFPHRRTNETESSDIGFPLSSVDSTELQPTILAGRDVDELIKRLQPARLHLLRATRLAESPLAIDAARVHWNFFKSLERLPVPLAFWEAEATRHWGVRTIDHLARACAAFSAALGQEQTGLRSLLREAARELDGAAILLRDVEPPLWTALCGMIIDNSERNNRFEIVLPSQASTEIFLLGVLTYLGIAEPELDEHKVSIRSLAGRGRSLAPIVPESLVAQTALSQEVLVGVPPQPAEGRLLPLLGQRSIEVLLYPHQVPAFTSASAAWIQALQNPYEQIEVLEFLTQTKAPEVIVVENRPRLSVLEPTLLTVATGQRQKQASRLELDKSDDTHELLSRILSLEEDEPGASPESTESMPPTGPVWVPNAVHLVCEDGWQLRAAPEDQVNVVIQVGPSTSVQEREAKAIRYGDRLLLINGQRRQSIYELLISRIHQRPSMELHLALIRRWSVDFANAYQEWAEGGRTLDDLLHELQRSGSTITSLATLRSWLQGDRLAPQDSEDLRRLAQVMNMTFVEQYHRRIAEAASVLRGLHRGLANRMNRWLERRLSGSEVANDNEVVNEELGLTFGDFRNSLVVARVVSTNMVSGPFLRTSLGTLSRGGL